MPLPMIALEEHFVHDPTTLTCNPSNNPYTSMSRAFPSLQEDLLDVGARRLAAMDASACSMQILSHAPVLPALNAEQCMAANNALHAHIQAHPQRFAGFAVLPIDNPSACVTELERCVTSLRLVGALIDSHTGDGTYYDGAAYRPLFAAAQTLDVPIYIHPTWPTPAMTEHHFTGNFPASTSVMLGSATFGWHTDVATHVLRLFASGLFDEMPSLKIIIGHMGETLPFMLGRIDGTTRGWGLRRGFAEVWRENLWLTTSGNWDVAPLVCILRNTPLEHVMMSVDYPFGKHEAARGLLEEVERLGLVDEHGLEMLASGNARALLKLEALKDV